MHAKGPMQGGQPPMHGGQPPMQGGQPPMQGGHPQMHGGHPQMHGGQPQYAPPMQGGYQAPPPMQGGYQAPPPMHAKPPMQQGYGAQQGMPAYNFGGKGSGHYKYAQYYPRMKDRPKVSGEMEGHYNGGYMADMLMAVRGLYIKEKTDWGEILTGFERENTYKIMDLDEKKGATLFKAKEKSSCCSRNFSNGDCRPFNVKIENQLDRDRTCIWLEKPQTCTMQCFGRPVLDVFVVNDQNNEKIFVGKVIDPFECCEFAFEIRDHDDKPVYTFHTPKCQQAMLCGNSFHCDECKKVDFEVKDVSGQTVTQAKRRGKGFLQNAMSDADKFEIKFTPKMPWNHRVLLLSTVIFIDFRMFETNANKDK